MADQNGAPVKSVSSLRSMFEGGGQVNQAPPPRPAAQKPQLRPSGQDEARPNTPVRMSLDLPRPLSSAQNVPTLNGRGLQTPEARQRRASPPSSRQRPLSMVSLTPKRSPPLVTVDSPQSPPKHTGSPAISSARSPILKPAGFDTESPGTVKGGHFRSQSRATTPALEARMSMFLQNAGSSENLPKPDRPPSPASERPKSLFVSAPPPVNRAGKPKISAGLSGTPDKPGLKPVAPDSRVMTPEERDLSPFSTPPSSSENTPGEQVPPPIHEHLKPRIPASVTVQDGYFAAPAIPRRIPERRREEPSRFLARSPTLPANYQFAQPRAINVDGMSPEERPVLPARHETMMGSGRTSPIRQQVPPRPELQTRSGRTSPTRQNKIPARKSEDVPRTASSLIADTHAQFLPPPRRAKQSALLQGFDRSGSLPPALPSASTAKPAPPAVPAPRRSTEHRRRDITPPSSNGHSRVDDYEDPPVLPNGVNLPGPADYPDSSQANRRPPRFQHRPWHIATGYDTRLFAVCGEYVCTTGYVTRVWNLRTGESLGTLSLGDNIKVTSIVFKPAIDVADEGKRLWLGTNIGEIHELDIPSQSIVFTKPNAHPRREIIKMYRHASEIWSLDDDGKLHVWPPGPNGIPSLEETPNAFRVPKGHSFSVQCGNQLWVATGKDVRVFQPSAATETAFQLLQRPLSQPNAGDVTSGATITSKPDLIYFGHADGKVSIYNKRDYTCQGVINVSVYKISAMAGVGDDLWAGYNTGMAYVYDISNTPWRVKKDWKAHDNPVCSIQADQSSIWKLDRLQVISLGTDNMIRIWDGMLREDWLDAQMQEHDDEFCDFQEVTAAVLTWNAGASKPTSLRNDERDNNFFRDYMSSHNPPDIWVFGFQELVDLEDKKVTAKSFFKSKKKDPTEQEHMSHQYRAWRDHLTRCLEDYMPANQPYTLLHTASMVGLFSCVYVKSAIRSRIKHIHTAEVKRGMGGLHGNKGALILRLALDDTSLCLINCHLAAGQSQTIARNNDVAAILEAECLPPLGPPLGSLPDSSLFVSGGDGSMILDHEICILNGDLNYRIDAMSRDTVVKAVLQRNLAKLLERDQLLLSRKKNPGFRLRAFSELPISFAPTYKYNVGADEYDTSEKKRSPAWCDRIMCRGVGRVKGEEYRRWEVRVSDHRPVSCRFRCRVKRIDSSKKMRVRDRLEGEFERFRDRVAGEVKLDYLVNVFGLSKKEAQRVLQV